MLLLTLSAASETESSFVCMVPTDWLAFLPALHATEQLFVILSQARSGTSWLNGMLNSHPDIFADEEIFMRLHNRQVAVARRNGLQCAFCQSHLRHLGAQSTDPALRGAPQIGELQSFLRRRANTSRPTQPSVFGFKLLNGQAGIELSHVWDKFGFWRGNEPLTSTFESWLLRERAKIVVLLSLIHI